MILRLVRAGRSNQTELAYHINSCGLSVLLFLDLDYVSNDNEVTALILYIVCWLSSPP